MSDNAKELVRYPLPVYNYRVSILSGQSIDDALGSTISVLSFSKVSGLSVDYEKVEFRHGTSFKEGVIVLPGIQQSFQLTLSRGVAKDKNFLYDWISNIGAGGDKMPVKRDLIIDLCNEFGEAIVRWFVQGALPVKLSAPEFDANSNEIAIETLEMVARQLSVEHNP